MTSLQRQRLPRERRRRGGGALYLGSALLVLGAALILVIRTLPHPMPSDQNLARAPSRPTIVVTIDGSRRPINPLVYGAGAGVSTSTYQPPIAQWAARLSETLRQSGVTSLRFGADHADDFDWEHSLLYPPDGPPQRVGIGNSGAQGIATFLAFARRNAMEPIIVVNAELDDPQQAARLVDYTLSHGRPVTYWEIGNEPYQWRHFALPLNQRRPSDQQKASPDDYAAIVVAYARAMRAAAARHPYCLRSTPPCLHIIADEWITNATDQSWTTTVDLIDTHYYSFFGPSTPPREADVAAGAFAAPALHRLSLTGWLTDLTTTMRGFSGSEDLQVMVGSWGLDTSPPAGNHYGSFAQALFTAQMVGQMVGQGVQIANGNRFYGAGEDQALIDYTGTPRAGLHALTLFTRHFGRWFVESSASASASRAALWCVAAATAPTNGDLTLVVVNNAPHRRVAAEVVLTGRRSAAPPGTVWRREADAWTLVHDRPDGPPSYGTTGLRHTVRDLAFGPTSFSYTFPAYSVTLLRLHRR